MHIKQSINVNTPETRPTKPFGAHIIQQSPLGAGQEVIGFNLCLDAFQCLSQILSMDLFLLWNRNVCLPWPIVCWEHLTFFFDFIWAQSYKFAFSFREDFELEIFSNAGTVKTLETQR